MSRAHDIAQRAFDGAELTSDEVRDLAQAYLRLHMQRALDDPGMPAPPADPSALRRAIEDIVNPPEDKLP